MLLESSVLMDRLTRTAEEGDLAGRDTIWLSILPLVENNPLVGVGKTGYDLFTYRTFGGDKSPHNVVIEILSYTGLIGLIIYSYFLFRIVQSSVRIYKFNGTILPLLLLIPIASLFLAGQALSSKIVWIIFAFVAAQTIFIHKIKNKKVYDKF